MFSIQHDPARTPTLKPGGTVPGDVSEGYVVAIKPTARKASAAAGEHVRDVGPTREFDSRAAAEAWVREEADGAVWVRDANPNDGSPADGYLMSWRHAPDPAPPDPPGEQDGLERYGVPLPDDDGEQVPLGRYDLP